MKYCTYCGKQLPDDAVFCGKCGRRVEPDRETTGSEQLKKKKIGKKSHISWKAVIIIGIALAVGTVSGVAVRKMKIRTGSLNRKKTRQMTDHCNLNMLQVQMKFLQI